MPFGYKLIQLDAYVGLRKVQKNFILNLPKLHVVFGYQSELEKVITTTMTNIIRRTKIMFDPLR